MKKREKAEEIRRRAYEYAKSGEHRGWLSIEHRIQSEGLPEAKGELDNQHIRRELDLQCKIATSPEENERRQQFQRWLEDTLHHVVPVLKDSAQDVALFVRDMCLFVNWATYSLEIRRKFGSRELEVTKVFEAADGQRYRTIVPERLPDLDFRQINYESVVRLIEQFDQSGSTRGRPG